MLVFGTICILILLCLECIFKLFKFYLKNLIIRDSAKFKTCFELSLQCICILKLIIKKAIEMYFECSYTVGAINNYCSLDD